MIILGWVSGAVLFILGLAWAKIAAVRWDDRRDEVVQARQRGFTDELGHQRAARIARAQARAIRAQRLAYGGFIAACTGLGMLLALAARGMALGAWFH